MSFTSQLCSAGPKSILKIFKWLVTTEECEFLLWLTKYFKTLHLPVCCASPLEKHNCSNKVICVALGLGFFFGLHCLPILEAGRLRGLQQPWYQIHVLSLGVGLLRFQAASFRYLPNYLDDQGMCCVFAVFQPFCCTCGTCNCRQEKLWPTGCFKHRFGHSLFLSCCGWASPDGISANSRALGALKYLSYC